MLWLDTLTDELREGVQERGSVLPLVRSCKLKAENLVKSPLTDYGRESGAIIRRRYVYTLCLVNERR